MPAHSPINNDNKTSPDLNAMGKEHKQTAIEQAYACDVSEVLSALNSQRQGLNSTSVRERRERFGPNSLPQAKPTPAWLRLLRQFGNPLIYVLFVAAGVSLFLGHVVDAGVILAVVVLNGLVGFIQEGKAEQALLAILAMAKGRSQVMRDGQRISIDSSELVPGDIVFLEAGDRVPADLRLIDARELRCDESALTGESLTVDKQNLPIDLETPLAERNNLVFMGTMVRFGNARAVVTHTGSRTQLGAITTLVQDVKFEHTPLQHQLAHFARQLSVLIVLITFVTCVYGVVVQDFALGEMFQSAIGIAVAAIPEGLPAVVTIALAIGVQRMAKHRALVRQLPAVEVLGSVDVICTDKTGTLTTNVMTARSVVTASSALSISGGGYSPEGRIQNDQGEEHFHHTSEVLKTAGQIALLCNDASLVFDKEQWQLAGDPTEGALLGFGLKTGLTKADEESARPRINEIPFASERRYMATLHQHANREQVLYVKGAPDRLLDFCSAQLSDEGIEALNRDYWQQQLATLAEQGMRVIALAFRPWQNDANSLQSEHAEAELTLAALIGIADPPRPEAIESIKRCHEAGIRVKMITGDNPVTAAAIGRELGLNVHSVLTGHQLEALSAGDLLKRVDEVDIYARTSPANKLQLVEALQKNGHIVAMTGDGVNDAPALKRANIGVAMGGKGTDAAKEASHFILTDDNFATITRAIREGRTVYDNIVKSILYILPTSLAEASVIVTAVLFGLVLPLTPVQVLWVNMVTGVTLSLALAFELGEANIMTRSPRPPNQSLISSSLLRRLIVIVLCVTLVIFWLFNRYINAGVSVEYARTIAVNALVLFELFYLFNGRFLHQFAFGRGFGNNPAVWISMAVVIVLQLLFTYLPISQRTFGLESINLQDWLWLVLATAPIMVVVEVEKWVGSKMKSLK